MFTEYSLWFLPLIVVVAFVCAYLSYGKFRFGKKNNEDDTPAFVPKQKYILFALRFSGILLILFLFLSPVKQTKNKTVEKPTVVLIQDNSSSLSAVKEPFPYTLYSLRYAQAFPVTSTAPTGLISITTFPCLTVYSLPVR